MWLTHHDVVSRTNLVLTTHCSIRCLGCRWWELDAPHLSSHHLTQLIQTGQFFDEYPITQVYNIMGGDPLLFEALPALLTLLKSEGIYIRFWTPIGYGEESLRQIESYVDEVVLYLPYPDANEYRTYTGCDAYLDIERWLTESNRSLRMSLHTWCTPLTVGWLPDIHELARVIQARFLITYGLAHEWHRDELDFIHRYQSIKGCMVVPIRRRHRQSCPAIPMAMLQSDWGLGWQWLSGVMKEWIPRV